MRAAELGLVGVAAQAAADYEQAFPDSDFSSGRRSLQEQAHAMAVNCVLERDWIAKTYKPGVVMQALQIWAHAHYYMPSVDDVALAFVGIMSRFGDSDLAHLSGHLGGTAFDVIPETAGLDARAWLRARAIADGGKFLEMEGGLVRLHWQA